MDSSTPSSAARKPAFCTTIGRSSMTSTSRMEPGKLEAKAIIPRAAPGGIDILKYGLAGKHPPEGLADAARRGLHLYVGAHPDHGPLLCDHALSAGQLADHHRHGFSCDLILHGFPAFLIDQSLFPAPGAASSIAYPLLGGNYKKAGRGSLLPRPALLSPAVPLVISPPSSRWPQR